MKNILRSMYGMSVLPMVAMEAASEGSAAAENGPSRSRFTPEQIVQIRNLRAERHPDGSENAGKPIYTHAKLADMFGTKAGVISQIVRNRSHKDPNYVPVNDGK